MIDAHSDKNLKFGHIVVIVSIISILTALIIYALLQTPLHENIIYDLILNEMPKSGVTNPVTAVLLNFRVYDS